MKLDRTDSLVAAHISANQQSNQKNFFEESKEAIFRGEAALFERSPKRDFPLSLLLNSEEECVAVYRVGMSVDEILRDARNCIGSDRMTSWHLAPPIGGTWFTNPVGEQFVRKVVREAGVKKDR